MSLPERPSGGRGRKLSVRPAEQTWFTLDIVHDGGDWTGFEGDGSKGAGSGASQMGREPLVAVVESAARALAAQAGIAAIAGKACIVLSSDAQVRLLNAAWRGQDKPTNVLSFPAPPQSATPPGKGAPFLGDIILAAETLQREATAGQIPARHHLQHLVIHGLLHLLGYDHQTDGDAATMETLEIAALAAIGVANPYDDHEPTTAAGSSRTG